MKSLKITALIAIAFTAAGCGSTGTASTVTSASDFQTLRNDIAEVRGIASQAFEEAKLARSEAHANSVKINDNFRKSLRK